METHANPIQQQRQAKLSLLTLDDDKNSEQRKQIYQEDEHWGRSLETHSYLRQKLSHRYQSKRRSLKQLGAKTTLNRQTQSKQPTRSDKQSLKELLKRLQSKELKVSKEQSSKVNTIDSLSGQERIKRNQYKKIKQLTIRNYCRQRKVKQSIYDCQNNFTSQRMQLITNKETRRNQENQDPHFNSVLTQKNRPQLNQLKGKKFNSIQSRQQRHNRRLMFRKKTQNKENEFVGLVQFPVQTFFNSQPMKNSFMAYCNQRLTSNFPEVQSINKRTFQILQEINRTKSISNVKKLTSQSLKLKKPHLSTYSRISKDLSSFIDEQNRKKKSISLKNNMQNYPVKLQIRR